LWAVDSGAAYFTLSRSRRPSPTRFKGSRRPGLLDVVPITGPVSVVRAVTTPTRGRAPEIRALTGARGIPVLLIVLFHYHEWYGYPGRPWYDLIVSKGYLWVEFFFALSGFVLFYVHGARFGAGLTAEAVRSFLVSRLSRLYPLQLVTLLAMGILEVDRRIVGARQLGVPFFDVPPFEGRTAGTFLSNLFMVQAWGLHDGLLSWNAPAWFVSVELFLCLMCPVLILVMGRRFGWRAAALGGVSAALLVALAATSGRGLDTPYRHGLWRGTADFGVGLALGALFLAGRRRGVGGSTAAGAHTLVQIGTLVVLAGALLLGGPARTPRDLMIVAPMFALLFMLAHDRGLVAQALHVSWLTKLGEWSFAVYMVHYPVLYLLVGVELLPPSPLTCVIGLASSVAMGGLACRFVERPLGEAMRRRLSRALDRRASR
jgi:peptidoglycan/LPS O-acetylase OafA/YrhL